ncbi:hypothetical protein UFOVP617_52 [uncultured Caudovirales phage]|uniref:Uncharacterized protein n=1 Tax=uncultured Caudovirales phage TaxID=2100421 RepID=A0A6J5N340_9CAUD|nr:hypothetical protein UFOVP617_52 [uncultured Caudovirales phage]
MISTEIYIENQRLDLTKDLSTEFTYNIDDIKDFASRNTNFSKTIVLPGNAVNNKLFGHIFEFGSSNFYDENQPNVGYNFNVSKAASCMVFIDKVQIFKGILRILEIVVDNGAIEYECAVFGELGGFVNALGNSKLENLDFSAYDHAWTITNIQNSWDSVNGAGYYYPLIDYGLVSTNKKDWDVKAYRPALYVREYMDKIITASGYTYEAPFFDTAVFRRLVIPNNQKTLSGYSTSGLLIYPTEKTYTGDLATIPLEFSNISQLGNFVASINDTIFTYTSATALTGKLDFSLQGLWATPYPGAISVRKNNVEIYNIQVGTGSSYNYFNVSIEIDPITFANGDTLRFVFVVSGAGRTEPNDLLIIGGNVQVRTDASQVVPINYGEDIAINSTLPKGIFQKDFFASIVKMFNMYVVEDRNKSNHLIIKPYIEFYDFDGQSLLTFDDFNSLLLVNNQDYLLISDGTIQYIDWTYKVDRSKPFKIKPMSELNGRYFEFKYKNDADYYNDQYQKKYSQAYGTRIEDSGYDFAKDKQTAEIIFAPTPLVGYDGEDKVFSTIFKLNNNVEDVTEHVIRILQAKKITGVTSYAVKNGGTTLANLTTYGYAGHLDDPDAPEADLNFSTPSEIYFDVNTDYPTANLFNAYWSEYMAEITDKDSKLLSAFVYLKAKDIYSLDFSKLIMIDGALWRLNNVQDYNPMDVDTTKAEFLKVIELTYE